MTTLKVNIKKSYDLSYSIIIGTTLLEKLPEIILKKYSAHRYAIITDKTVQRLYGNRLLEKFRHKADLFAFEDGETHKILTTIERLNNQMTLHGHNRSSIIVAIGGGVVTDVAGFLAATFMRGIDYVSIPTTLLAMVDASIGGKTGVNSRLGKNMIGVFHHPKAVYIATQTLKTLPEKEYLNGFVELVKHALIRDRALFETMEKNAAKIIKKDLKLLVALIARSVAIKKKIVEQDEKEHGLRMLLNYGHTLGHGIEKASNYRIKHGFAVAIGIRIMNKFCIQNKWLKEKEGKRIDHLFETLKIPTEFAKTIAISEILEASAFDKKRRGDQLNFVALKKIGAAEIRQGKIDIGPLENS
ncbi:3-dehydroquinate synthase [Candidatus Peregrinibacteria bacterium]|nr:3-dehydroquinate synthase [Candidatus Peregrinibacteria bacterium]